MAHRIAARNLSQRNITIKALVLDLETKVTRYDEGRHDIDGSPYQPNNGIVSANWRVVDLDTLEIGPDHYSVFYHDDLPAFCFDGPEELQAAIDACDIIVAHNLKFDLMWLIEAWFKVDHKKVWCTMIGEYVLARGVGIALSLKETAIRRGTSLKKSDLVDKLFYDGVGFEAIPLATVLEYAEADVLSCAEIFVEQWTEFQDVTKTRKLRQIIDLMNDMLLFLAEIERNGIAIDLAKLDEVEAEYILERDQLIKDLETIVVSVMGDTPINLRSGADISKLVYSRELTDKKLHIKTFNIGVDEHGNDRYPPWMTANQFANAVRATTKRVEKTVASNCHTCNGNKFVRKHKKGGGLYKNESKCPECKGEGFKLWGTGKVAGLKLSPFGPRDASVNGFKAGKDELDRLIAQAYEKDNLEAVEFLSKKKRLNAVNTYLDSFVAGIRRWTRADGLLHASFNQCVARTGRLSSSDPNFQNQPKGHKFPVRKCIISRWQDSGGLILEADFSGLEFVVAGELSRDKQIIEDILNKKDVHRQTGSIVHQKAKEEITKDERDAVKPYTFAPLYGGQGANEPPHIRAYFQEFFKIYSGHEAWQFDQMDAVIQKGYIATPSGREYRFPGTKRLKGRRTSNATNIVNYPVQGFATGDIVPLACIRALRRFKQLGLHSLLILTVHDSIVVDVYPGELEAVAQALSWAMNEIDEEIKERWDYDMVLPLRSETSVGINWGQLEKLA